MSAEYHWSGVINFLKGQQDSQHQTEWATERTRLVKQLETKQQQLKETQTLHQELTDRVRKLESALRQERFKFAQTVGGHHRVNSDELSSIIHKQKEQPHQRRSQRPRLSEVLEPEPRSSNYAGAEEEEMHQATKWHPATTLRSHMDGVRVLHFLSRRLTLVSGSEDFTVKAWDLENADGREDIEPYLTLRGHTAPVLCLTGAHEFGLGQVCESIIYSGDAQGVVKVWDIEDPEDVELYEPSRRHCFHSWNAHEDAIWTLVHHSIDSCILSLGADHSVKVWKTKTQEEYKHASWRRTAEHPIFSTIETDTPTVCCWVHTHPPSFAVGYSVPHLRLHNRDTGQTSVLHFSGSENAYVNCIASSLLSPILISGHEDRRIRLFDLNAGRCVQEIVGHTEGVSALSIHSSGMYLVSGGHDGSLRSWDLRRFQCVQEIPAHRKKYGEAVHCVVHAPNERLMASGGADSVIKVFK